MKKGPVNLQHNGFSGLIFTLYGAIFGILHVGWPEFEQIDISIEEHEIWHELSSGRDDS